ncbi:MAG: ABC-2 type transport system permease protein [Candidatus Nitrotoga sp. SPKER]|nr:MAG: ABC-2 type transport system permease protein [Candidatus Nitrotoga sp. SPKER]
MDHFSFSRWWAIVLKEFLQLKRDRVTFAMIVGLPIIQLLLFGYAINSDPKHLPTAVVISEQSEFTRSYLAAMKMSGYFEFVAELPNEQAARAALAQGKVQFVVNFPTDFTRKLLRGERPALLIEVDATDPMAASAAIASVRELTASVAKKDFKGVLASLGSGAPPFDVRVHKLYNPEGLTQHNIVPGLMGVILTMTMVMMTGLAITRERERGTMENLLSMPGKPIEVITGKIVPYVFIGLIQITIILLAARYLFEVPFVGSVAVLYVVALFFIAANLMVGITLSSIAKNQLQAVQLTIFYFMPSILISGFMFPFQGMPQWAQAIGSMIPATYFMRAVRGILLKGNSWVELWPSIWPMLMFMVVVMTFAVITYRKTLD